MKRFCLALLALAALPALLLANGDPVITYSANIRSCNPVPLKVSQVQVVREDLDVSIAVPYTSVQVAYRLKNNSNKPVHVDYGFPVDFSGSFDVPYGYTADDMTESLTECGIASRAVRGIRFRLDGTELPWTRSDEVVMTGETIYDEETDETVEVRFCRLWTYTVLDIPAGETVLLEVDYEVLCQWDVNLNRVRISPLSRYFPTWGQFVYDFTPAQHWGNGKTDMFNCSVHCDALPKDFFHNDDWVSPELYCEGAPFKRFNPTTWTCNTKNLDFAKAKGFQVSFHLKSIEEGLYPHWGDPLRDCRVPASAYTVKVSGAQANYPATNMLDNNPATAWVATGDGVGATIDIDFAKPRRISDIGFYNGYHKSAALWAANSRIKKLRLEVTRADGFRDEPEEIDVSDYDMRYYTLREDHAPRFGEISLLTITDINRMLGRITGLDEETGIYQVEEVPFTSEYVSHIRLTVLEVTPGAKYKDLCVSDLILLDGFGD